MSMDLFQGESTQRLQQFGVTKTPDPGVFDNFWEGSGKYAMQIFAKTARSIDMARAIKPIAIDALLGGTSAQDAFFRDLDETTGDAVKYWTPAPNEVGVAGQVVGGLLGTLPQIFANAPLAVGTAVNAVPLR